MLPIIPVAIVFCWPPSSATSVIASFVGTDFLGGGVLSLACRALAPPPLSSVAEAGGVESRQGGGGEGGGVWLPFSSPGDWAGEGSLFPFAPPLASVSSWLGGLLSVAAFDPLPPSSLSMVVVVARAPRPPCLFSLFCLAGVSPLDARRGGNWRALRALSLSCQIQMSSLMPETASHTQQREADGMTQRE